MSLKIEDIIEVLRQESLPSEKLVKIETELEKLEQVIKEERASTKAPKTKNEYVIVVRGDAALKQVLQQGWVMQVKPGTDIQNLPHTMKAVAHSHNAGQKRKKNPLKTFREFFQYCKRRWTKEKDIHIKTKQPVQVVVLESENL